MGLRNILGIVISNVCFSKDLENRIGIGGESGDLILPNVLKSVKELEGAGVDFIVMPCNTLHVLIPELRKNCNLDFVDLIEETSKIVKDKYNRIGILCTNKTKDECLYDSVLENVEIIYPNDTEQKRVSEIIIKIIRGKSDKIDKIYLNFLINKMTREGAEIVLLACTDLVNLVGGNSKTLDTTQILIDSILRKMNDNFQNPFKLS